MTNQILTLREQVIDQQVSWVGATVLAAVLRTVPSGARQRVRHWLMSAGSQAPETDESIRLWLQGRFADDVAHLRRLTELPLESLTRHWLTARALIHPADYAGT